MMQDIRTHKTDYSLLLVLAGVFIVYFVGHRHNTHSLIVSTIVFGVAYFLWGIWHHGNTKSITKNVVLEYLLVAIFGIVIVCSLLL